MQNMQTKFKIAPSPIHGQGVFATRIIEIGETIGLAIKLGYFLLPHITENLGIWINHSDNPNSVLIWNPFQGGHVLASIDRILPGTEIVANYKDTPWYIEKSVD